MCYYCFNHGSKYKIADVTKLIKKTSCGTKLSNISNRVNSNKSKQIETRTKLNGHKTPFSKLIIKLVREML